MCTLLLSNKKFRSPYPFKRKKTFISLSSLASKEISFFVYVRALVTQKNCAVGMRSAILRNHLKNGSLLPYAPSITPGIDGKWRSQSENVIRGYKERERKK